MKSIVLPSLRPTAHAWPLTSPARSGTILGIKETVIPPGVAAMRETWTFHTAHQLVFGRNAVRQLGEISARLSAKKVLVVTDPILVKVGVAERVREPLAKAGVAVEVCSGGEPEPSLKAAANAIAAAKQTRPDALLGLGGGSNMDLAKITAVVLAHGGQPSDYFGDDKIPGPVAPLVCVPTTAGTGSEVSAASVLTDTKKQIKVGVLSRSEERR